MANLVYEFDQILVLHAVHGAIAEAPVKRPRGQSAITNHPPATAPKPRPEQQATSHTTAPHLRTATPHRCNDSLRLPSIPGDDDVVVEDSQERSDGDDDFSSGVSLLQVPDRFWDVAERIYLVDHRRDVACLDEFLQIGEVVLGWFRGPGNHFLLPEP
jgi:hypothetical protein